MWIVVVGAIVIGLTLGMLGSGGSAITVPVLVYLVGHQAKQAIAESMAIVGMISVAAAIPYGRAKLIDWRSVWFFGIPGMFGTFIGAWLGGLSPETLQLVVFGVVLIAAAIVMVRGSSSNEPEKPTSESSAGHSPIWKIVVDGTVVGVVTGFVGVGGGFLIVPALVVFGKLPMRIAIGTSLVIIALKSAIGFVKYQHYLMQHEMSIDLLTVSLFTTIGIAGSFVGKYLNSRMNQGLLKRSFAIFLIVLGGWLIFHEGSKAFSTPVPPRLESVSPSARQKIMSAKDELFGKLSGRLMQVLQEQGPAAAIKVCSEEAPQIARTVSSERGLTIARTSLQLRNAKNQPPDWAKPLLKRDAPTEPEFFDIGDGHVGALLPIKLQATCLMCHGPRDQLLDEVKAELTRYYPSDRATGYREGDLRGWFWVDLPPRE